MKKTKLAILMALLPFAVEAQQMVPAIEPMQQMAAIEPPAMEWPSITISPQERQALNIAGKWLKQSGKPTLTGDGGVQYVFGVDAPTLVCTPLHVCAIRFRPGEVINTLNVGDAARWNISRTSFGSGGQEIEVVMVKPREPGLVTNMAVTTSERIYMIVFKAARKEWMPFITFHYPEDDLKALAQDQGRRERQVYSSTLSNGMNVAALDFGYKITGDNVSWKPIRVYTDGTKTYIEFDSLGNEAPVFVELQSKGGMFSDPETKIVNNSFIGKKLVVDGIPKLSALIVGVGINQRMVTIEKIGGPK